MLAGIVYRLEALSTGNVPVSHGRFVHAAAMQFLTRSNQEMAKVEHDRSDVNNFTVSMLDFGNRKPVGQEYHLLEGTTCSWRVTAMREDIARIFLSIQVGEQIQVGSMKFRVMAVICDPNLSAHTGCIGKKDFIAGVFSLPRLRNLTIKFISPTTFRVNDRDYPYPLPELIFTSLAKKCEKCLGVDLPINEIKEISMGLLLPIKWSGETRRAFFGPKGGATGFVGSFTYDITMLDDEQQKLFLLLAEFAVFSGTGRLTGQGFGQTQVEYHT